MSDGAVYNLWHNGLGDHWASLNLLARMSEASDAPVSFVSPRETYLRNREILTLLDLGTVRPRLSHLIGTGNRDLDGFHVWACPYFPTIQRWSPGRVRGHACVHFDGLSSAADKNPSAEDADSITRWLIDQGLMVTPLTRAMSLAQMVQALATCSLFVGCDSGPSHIAHSVGCPTYLLEYKLPVVTCHRHKAYVLCTGVGSFQQQASNWINYLRNALH